MKDHFYVMLFGNASQDIYPYSAMDAFTLRLAQPIDLGFDDQWEAGLSEFTCPPLNVGTFNSVAVIGEASVLVHCNLITLHFVGNSLVRCLRSFIHPTSHCQHIFQNVYYLPLKKMSFQDITTKLLITEGKHMRLPDRRTAQPIKLVLHFRRVRN